MAVTAAASGVTPMMIRFGRLGDTILLQPLLRKLERRLAAPVACWPWATGRRCRFRAARGGRPIPLCSQYGSPLFSPGRWRAALALREFRHAPIDVCEPGPRDGSKVRPTLALAGIPPAHCAFIQPMTMRDDEHWIDWRLRFADQTPPAFRASHATGAAENHAGLAPQLQAIAAERHDRDAWLGEQGLLGRPLAAAGGEQAHDALERRAPRRRR